MVKRGGQAWENGQAVQESIAEILEFVEIGNSKLQHIKLYPSSFYFFVVHKYWKFFSQLREKNIIVFVMLHFFAII